MIVLFCFADLTRVVDDENFVTVRHELTLADVMILKQFPDSVLVDIRAEDIFSRSHMPGAINLTVARLEEKLPERLAASANVVIYSQSPARRNELLAFADLLEQRGIRNVKLYVQGYDEWKACGLSQAEGSDE